MINGIIIVKKEAGFTSHDVVAKLRGIFKQKKIGHTGTLDPDAVGALPVCLGKGTKVCSMLTDTDKTYRCVMLLGRRTDTQDISGRALSECDVVADGQAVRDAILSFQGEYDQVPPMYSALKVKGQKLCDLARAGKEVERAPRRVTIHRIQIQEIQLPRVIMEVECSKGTYIRTLCDDIGEKLGCGACMEHLTRIKAAGFSIEESHTLGEIEMLVRAGRAEEWIIPVDRLFLHLPEAHVRPEFQKALDNGNCLPVDALLGWEAEWEGQELRVYDSAGAFVGIYRHQGREGGLKPTKLFYEAKELPCGMR